MIVYELARTIRSCVQELDDIHGYFFHLHHPDRERFEREGENENVIDFPNASRRRRKPYSQRGPKNRHKLVFRSYEHIVESNEADLIQDVCFDIDRAESKLRRVKQRLKNVLVESAAEVKLLSTAETKLTAAIVAALLSTASDRN
jgi:hypothetical protein